MIRRAEPPPRRAGVPRPSHTAVPMRRELSVSPARQTTILVPSLIAIRSICRPLSITA